MRIRPIFFFAVALISATACFSAVAAPAGPPKIEIEALPVSVSSRGAIQDRAAISLDNGQSIMLAVDLHNSNKEEQRLYPCASGIWTTDNGSIHVSTGGCDYNKQVTIRSGETYKMNVQAQYLSSAVFHSATGKTMFNEVEFRLGLLPQYTIYMGVLPRGPQLDANTSWSKPIAVKVRE